METQCAVRFKVDPAACHFGAEYFIRATPFYKEYSSRQVPVRACPTHSSNKIHTPGMYL